MKLTTFVVNKQQRLGAVACGDQVVIDLAAAERSAARREKRKANAFYGDMITFLQAGSRGMAGARRLDTRKVQ